MISLKIIQTPFAPTARIAMFDMRSSRRHFFILTRSKPDGGSDPDTPPPKGDLKRQDLLAKIVMLQAEKARLTDFLDERSAYLTQFAEDANAEFDAIGESALKDLDESTARIMENMESRMQDFEESARQSKMEIEKSDRELAEFEGEVEKGRNEGLFFQSLREKSPADKEKAMAEARKISEVTKRSAAPKTRRNIYVGMMGVVGLGIGDSVGGSAQDWRKIAVLGAIMVGLISQFLYERGIQSEVEKQESNMEKEEED